jgi:(p)ppGpp synthase/HD superfamily hydrolase
MMATIEKALQIAAGAHAGQVDKEGLPYIFHPLRVMAAVEGLEAKIVAIFHDVIEDTPVTADDLRREGFAEPIVASVLLVTHRKDEPYADYVIRCKGDDIARRVKLADLEDNSRLSRAILRPERMDHDLARIRRYVLSHKFLTGRITEEQYRAAMEGAG